MISRDVSGNPSEFAMKGDKGCFCPSEHWALHWQQCQFLANQTRKMQGNLFSSEMKSPRTPRDRLYGKFSLYFMQPRFDCDTYTSKTVLSVLKITGQLMIEVQNNYCCED